MGTDGRPHPPGYKGTGNLASPSNKQMGHVNRDDPQNECDAIASKGSGKARGRCGGQLDEYDNCDRISKHIGE